MRVVARVRLNGRKVSLGDVAPCKAVDRVDVARESHEKVTPVGVPHTNGSVLRCRGDVQRRLSGGRGGGEVG